MCTECWGSKHDFKKGSIWYFQCVVQLLQKTAAANLSCSFLLRISKMYRYFNAFFSRWKTKFLIFLLCVMGCGGKSLLVTGELRESWRDVNGVGEIEAETAQTKGEQMSERQDGSKCKTETVDRWEFCLSMHRFGGPREPLTEDIPSFFLKPYPRASKGAAPHESQWFATP